MICTVLAFWAKKYVFLVSNFLIFVPNRFVMLHIFYKKLRSGDIAQSCLWLWPWIFILKVACCYYSFSGQVSNKKKVFNFIISCISLQLFLCNCIVCVGVSSPLKNTTPVFFAKPPLNLQTVQAPTF